ncbi:hypothetical protein [Microbacterium sp. NPDC089188]|uniref:hypothetical protein n=1 Tax=Microbacterium sp. NPDC089188 TaxID=3154971 RepID=UPI0034124FFB
MDGWTAILGFLGILATGYFTTRGVGIGAARERDHWLRTERMAAYTDFLTTIDRGVSGQMAANLLGDTPPRVDEMVQLMIEPVPLLSRIAVLGPAEVYDEASRFLGANMRANRDESIRAAGGDPNAGTVTREHEKPVAPGEVADRRHSMLKAMRAAIGDGSGVRKRWWQKSS